MSEVLKMDSGNWISYFHKNNGKKEVVLLLHGLGGTKHEWGQFDRFSKLLEDSFDVFSIDFRGSKSNDSILQKDMNLKTLKQDVEFIFRFLKNDYDKIFVVGLSLGAVAYLISKVSFDKAVLWSPGNLKRLWERYKKRDDYMSELREKGYFDKGDILIGEEFYEECGVKTLHEDANKKKCPVLIVHGTKDEIIPYRDSLEIIKEFGTKIKSVHLIKGSDHNFSDPVFEEELFKVSKEFLLKKF